MQVPSTYSRKVFDVYLWDVSLKFMLGQTEVEVPCLQAWFMHLWQLNKRLTLHDSSLSQHYVTGQVTLRCILVLSLELTSVHSSNEQVCCSSLLQGLFMSCLLAVRIL